MPSTSMCAGAIPSSSSVSRSAVCRRFASPSIHHAAGKGDLSLVRFHVFGPTCEKEIDGTGLQDKGDEHGRRCKPFTGNRRWDGCPRIGGIWPGALQE